jgi:ubiquinone/menaquinone biosynthesis C-methylase UbiE
VVDRQFSVPRLAALYDRFCAGRPDLDFYLPIVKAGDSVLDVGCGTGQLLGMARAAGHNGRLCGLDPAPAMLDEARKRTDIEWILGDLSSTGWDQEFDRVVMTGHAFQVLLEDDEIRFAMSAVRRALRPNGQFVFETRNPLDRAWQAWTPQNATEIITGDGATVHMEHVVDAPAAGFELISFTTTYTSRDWPRPEISRSTLRFLPADSVRALLEDAGFSVAAQFGYWDRQPFDDASPEIITVAVPQ